MPHLDVWLVLVKAFLQLLDRERLESDFYRRTGQSRKRADGGRKEGGFQRRECRHKLLAQCNRR